MSNLAHTYLLRAAGTVAAVALGLGCTSGGQDDASDTSMDASGPDPSTTTGASSTSDASTTTDSSSSSSDDEGTTTEECSTGIYPPPPDLPDPMSLCPEGTGDLELLWSQVDPAAERAGAVAVGAGRVAWTAATLAGAQLRVLDLDGTPSWEQPVPLWPGEADLALQDLAIDPEGGVVLAGTITGMAFDGLLHWYDAEGALVNTYVEASPDFDLWHGVVVLDGGDIVAVGESNDAILVERFDVDALPVWAETLAEPGSLWASDVAVAPDGRLLVSGHTNAVPGPVLLAYDGDGTPLWEHVDDDGSELDVAMSVAVDAMGRAWMTVSEDSGGGRVERYDAAGTLEAALPLDFLPNAIAIAPDDSIAIAGADLVAGLVIVERRSPAWDLLARYERAGRRAMGVAVDDDCHTYMVGHEQFGGAWLEVLR